MNWHIDLTHLDLKKIGTWPRAVQAVLLIILSVLLLSAGLSFSVSNKEIEVKEKKQTFLRLKRSFSERYHKANTLSQYQDEIKAFSKEYQKIETLIPDKFSVSALLDTLATYATSAQLTYEGLDPLELEDHDYYIVQPIKVSLSGTYHGFAKFAESVGKLNKVVTFGNFIIKKQGGDKQYPLSLDVTLNLYWKKEPPKAS